MRWSWPLFVCLSRKSGASAEVRAPELEEQVKAANGEHEAEEVYGVPEAYGEQGEVEGQLEVHDVTSRARLSRVCLLSLTDIPIIVIAVGVAVAVVLFIFWPRTSLLRK